MFDVMASSIAHIKAGKLRTLAVTPAKRSEALPNVPTVGDFVPGYEASAVGGFGVPNKSTAPGIVNKLNAEINAAPADFGKLIAEENEKWAKVIKCAGIKPE
jgi:tripartite-type tricarboxylate transporter receptor subunit TctC